MGGVLIGMDNFHCFGINAELLSIKFHMVVRAEGDDIIETIIL